MATRASVAPAKEVDRRSSRGTVPGVSDDPVEAGYRKLLDQYGNEPVSTAMAALGILEEEFDLKIPEDFRADYPHAAADILQRKAAVHTQKRHNLFIQLQQRLGYIKPTEAKLYLTIPCGEKLQWNEFRSSLGSVEIENKDSAFYAEQCERNARSMKKYDENTKRKFSNFIGDMLTDKARQEAGSAKTLASKQRLQKFRKDQGEFYKQRGISMQKKQDQIKSQTAKEMERREEYAEESTRKIAEKYARSDACKQQVLADLQVRADKRTEKFEEVMDKKAAETKAFIKYATGVVKNVAKADKEAAILQEAAKKEKAQMQEDRKEELKKFLQRKREHEGAVQNMRETKFRAAEEKYERSRERSQNERLQKSKSMGNTLNLQYNRWRAEKNRQDESYLEFTRSVEDMHARQQKQADDAKYRCFVSDVEEKRARHGIFGDLQKANHDRNKREQESFQNANLVHVTLRNKALANIQAQRDEMQAMRQKMFMELGVKADEAKDVFYRLKGENDPDKIARMLKKLNVDLPDVRKTLDPNWVDPAKAAAEQSSAPASKPLF